MTQCKDEQDIIIKSHCGVLYNTFKENQSCKTWDGEDMWTQGLFISMYDRIHYK